MTKLHFFITLLMSFPFTSLSFAEESNSINFIDPRTQLASDIETGEGLQAILTLPLTPEQRKLEIEIYVFPEFKLDQAPLYEKKIKVAGSDVSGLWQKSFKIPSFQKYKDILTRFGRVARFRISWKNEVSGEEGTLIRKFYLLESQDQKFFKILAPGNLIASNNSDPESVCSYRRDFEIVGPYLQNPSLSPQEYSFNQSVALETLRYRGALNALPANTLGYTQGVAPPFQVTDNTSLGWLMTGWTHFEGKETKLSFQPKIILQAGQGGYFIKETLMKTFKAQLYTLKKKSFGHDEWQEAETGLLDAGSIQFDFVTLSFEDSQNPAKTEKLLAERSQLMSTCTSYPLENDRVFHGGSTNTINEELYFRPL